MFPLPVANGKGRPASLAGTQFAGSGRTEGYLGVLMEICLVGGPVDSGISSHRAPPECGHSRTIELQ